MSTRAKFGWSTFLIFGLIVAIFYLLGAGKIAQSGDKDAPFDLLPWLGLLFDVLAKVDWLNALLLVTGAIIVALLLVAQFRPGDGFDMRSMFASRTGGAHGDVWTVEPGRVFQTGAFMVTTWALIWQVTHDKFTDTFLFIYVALWAGSRAMNHVIASKFPVQPGTSLDPPPPAPVATVTTKTEIST